MAMTHCFHNESSTLKKLPFCESKFCILIFSNCEMWACYNFFINQAHTFWCMLHSGAHLFSYFKPANIGVCVRFGGKLQSCKFTANHQQAERPWTESQWSRVLASFGSEKRKKRVEVHSCASMEVTFHCVTEGCMPWTSENCIADLLH